MSNYYRRILLKLSGTVFAHDGLLSSVIKQLCELNQHGIQVAVVPGGGNILRGREIANMDRVVADSIGMLATVLNGIRLAELLEKHLPVHHFAAFPIGNLVPGYSVHQARVHLDQGALLILSGGTGNPFFSTDSAAALRAAELKLDVVLKGTRVSGVFSADPETEPGAVFYPRLTYEEVINRNLKVLDRTAVILCQQHSIPIVVFDINQPSAILDIVRGEKIGSVIC
ncbi:MAG: uridine monophosphate kinase [candidate division WOR-3 bacterium]|uniref:Uridylate kinase n=1 Tax=candidate division WOR-3 bacterium TaxID=2052148 RepID=A0A7C1NF39_UNCW3|nr:uridine monophosphate kinase [candidate division WOR-3 bacterium]